MTRRTYRTATGTVVTHDQGAHLTEWRVRDSPVIWVSGRSEYAEGRPIRGGVPVCWPWFGPGRSGDLTPSHGFARIAPWRLVRERGTDGEAVRLEWELTDSDVAHLAGAKHFPHAFTARVQVAVDESATISLTVCNHDTLAWDYEAALHTYLHVGDVRQVQLVGLDGAGYLDKVTQTEGIQRGEMTFTGETDRVHTSGGRVMVHDPVLRRALIVDNTGSPNTVVWNPWAEKAAAMADLGDQEWSEMLGVEAAAVGAHAVRLESGAEHTMSTTVTVAPAE